jgi:hypothetical protein
MENPPYGFNNLNRFPQKTNKAPDKSDAKFYWISGIIIFILILGLLYVIFIVSNSEKAPSDSNKDINEQGQPPEISQSLISCGEDIDCFIDKTYECSLSDLTYSFDVNLFGWIQNHSYYYEIKGKENSNCTLYMRIENVSGEYDDSARQAFLDAGMASSEIDQQEQEINDALKATIGSDGTCSVPQAEFPQLFIDLKSGNLFSDIWSTVNCEGEMFSSQ